MIRKKEIPLKIGVAFIDEEIRELFEIVWSCLEESD
jgi:hypothetical protein